VSQAGAFGLAGLRLLLVGPVPPPAGGMANQTRQLGELLTQEGVHVLPLATNGPYRPAWLASWRGVRAAARLLAYVIDLWRSCGRVDMVHVMANSGWSWHLFAAPAIWVARLRGRPIVVNYRGGEAADFLARAERWVRPSVKQCAKLVVPSGFLLDVFGRHHMAAEVVPNIIDAVRFTPVLVPPPPFHVLVARNLEPLYDNGSALRALAVLRRKVPDACMTIAGTGPDLPMLKELAHDLGLVDAVRFAGRLERDAMATLYQSAHVLLNTSLVDNMPNSLLEAMASGVPIVSTRVGGVPYIVRDGETALLVGPRDVDAMAAALARLAQEPHVALALRERGLLEVQQYTWAKVSPRWAQVYREALAQRS
jgi:glycosyltransferase involved in cell wall biosynthesis